MTPTIFKLSDPKVAALMLDSEALQRWEVLRSAASPMTAVQLAEAWRVDLGTGQRTLDQLEGAGFIVKMPVSARSRSITYRAISDQVVVTWDRSSPADLQGLAEQRRVGRKHTRAIFDRAWEARLKGQDRGKWIEFDAMPTLTREESTEAMDIITTAARALEALSARAKQRARSTADVAEPAPIRAHLLAMQMIALFEDELPLPQLTIWEQRSVESQIAMITRAPRAVLTERETTIARRLASGESRPKIANALGLSKHTVATTSKRIYLKLGIHSRAELSARMQLG